MYNEEEIKYLEEQLNKLYDDRVGQVAKKSGKSRPTVSKFFSRKKIKPSNGEKIYEACVELIKEKRNNTVDRIVQIGGFA